MGMTSFVPHILYENNDQLYIGYSVEVDVKSLYNVVQGMTVQAHIASMYLKCRTFEDFPLAFTELMETIDEELIGRFYQKDTHRKLIFKSVADLTSVKEVIDTIDLGKDYGKLWSTQYISFMNLTDYNVRIISKESRDRKMLMLGEAVIYRNAEKPVQLVASDRTMGFMVRSVDKMRKRELLDQKISSGT